MLLMSSLLCCCCCCCYCQVRVLIKTYKLLGSLAKAHIPIKSTTATTCAQPGGLSKDFTAVVADVHKQLTPPVYNFISDTQEIARDSRRDTLSKIKRDARSIPQLVFQIEEWEKQLVLVGRATKTNLMRDAKRSTNRDFKINMVVPGTQRGHSRATQVAQQDADADSAGGSDEGQLDGEDEGDVQHAGDDDDEDDNRTEAMLQQHPEEDDAAEADDDGGDDDDDGSEYNDGDDVNMDVDDAQTQPGQQVVAAAGQQRQQKGRQAPAGTRKPLQQRNK
eukprot:jgi/Chrzof1/11316/Cz05g32070.t1